jgi:hypothetical protein
MTGGKPPNLEDYNPPQSDSLKQCVICLVIKIKMDFKTLQDPAFQTRCGRCEKEIWGMKGTKSNTSFTFPAFINEKDCGIRI